MQKKTVQISIDTSSSARDFAEYINRAIGTGDFSEICQAIGSATKMHDIKKIAERAGIARQSVYRAFSAPRKPKFETVFDVLDAMGLKLKIVTQRRKAMKTRMKRGPKSGGNVTPTARSKDL
jgi:probable addiction module antidote protein